MKTKTGTRAKSQQAYDYLKRGLQHGEFEPGERLYETKIAETLNLSRMPVREALQRLTQEGLVVDRGVYGGKYVRYMEDFSPDEILYTYELREAIESMAARLAAMNMTGWQIAGLKEREWLLEQSFNSSREERSKAAVEFYRYLFVNCGNPKLLQIWESYNVVPFMSRDPAMEAEIWSKYPPEHRHDTELRPIVDAIAAHDPDAAESLMREQVRNITDAIRKTVLDG